MPPEESPTPAATKKRTRKPSTPRAPRQKDPGILAIEKEANAKKEQYRLAQRSSGILKRIQKLVLRLTDEHKTVLFSQLSQVATPELLPPPAAEPNPDSLERAHRYGAAIGQ